MKSTLATLSRALAAMLLAASVSSLSAQTQSSNPPRTPPDNRLNEKGTAQPGEQPAQSRPARGEEELTNVGNLGDTDDGSVRKTGDAGGAQRMVIGGSAKTGSLQLATDEDLTVRVLRRFAGLDVRNQNGERLGTLKDVLVDKRAGTIAYGVVSKGGLFSAGDSLIAVPVQALQRSSDFRGFLVAADPAKLARLPTLKEEDLEAGRVTISAQQHERAATVFHTPDATNFAVQSTASNPADLQPATVWRGKSLQAGDQTVGKIEEIVVDWDTASVAALLDPDDEFTGTDTKYLVPIGKIEGGADAETLSTTLTRNEFQQAHSASRAFAASDGATVPPPRDGGKGTSADEANRPTGSTSAGQGPREDPVLVQAAQKIRQVMDADRDMTGANVRVAPEGEKIVLRGVVNEPALKSKILETARKAGGSAQIEDQIKVAGRRGQPVQH